MQTRKSNPRNTQSYHNKTCDLTYYGLPTQMYGNQYCNNKLRGLQSFLKGLYIHQK